MSGDGRTNVVMAGVTDATFNSPAAGVTVLAVPSASTFTYAQTAADATSGGGTCQTNFNGTFSVGAIVSPTVFTIFLPALPALPGRTGGGGTIAAQNNRYDDSSADAAIQWVGSPVLAPYVDIDQDLSWLGVGDSADCAAGPCDATMRGMVMNGSCSNYNTLKTLRRFWPSRGRYGPINIKVRATDLATRTLDSPSTAVTLVVPIFADVPISDWAWDQVERIRSVGITAGTSAFPASELPLKRFFSPDGAVTRTDQVVFILRSMGIVPTTVPATSPWQDVAYNANPASSYGYICKAFDLGITQGCIYDA